MPNTKNLAADALDEIGKAAYAREKHEMRNNKVRGGEDASLPGETGELGYTHKPIKR